MAEPCEIISINSKYVPLSVVPVCAGVDDISGIELTELAAIKIEAKSITHYHMLFGILWNKYHTKHYNVALYKQQTLPSQQQIPVCLLVQTDEVERTVVIGAKIEEELCFIIFKV